jgi:hypothetical protein
MAAMVIHQPPRGPLGNRGCAVAEEEAVTVIVAVLLLNVPTEHVTPASELDAEHVKVGVALKLLIGVKVSIDVPLDPGLSDRLLGDALSEKSEAAVANCDTPDHIPFWLPELARACTSQ